MVVVLALVWPLLMRFTLALAAICLAVSYAEPAISQARTTATTTSTKPGRFLSLPVPAKCASLAVYKQTKRQNKIKLKGCVGLLDIIGNKTNLMQIQQLLLGVLAKQN
uniref:Secreted protein n=1 Tax=Glossina austeni TaxID=7395 RepID=A0A1A9VA01_GLOAU